MSVRFGQEYASNDWVGSEKWELGYDEAGNQILKVINFWDAELNDWVYSLVMLRGIKEEYEYNLNGNQTLWVLYEWDSESNDWALSFKEFYYYSTSTGIEQITVNDLTIFPNPTSGTINITGLTHPAEVKIYSIQGQLLKSDFQVESIIDVSDLVEGIYILNLTTYKDRLVKKILVKK
jgi:hypothetical protein